MRSIDFCTPKPSLLEHPSPSSFPSAAIVCFFAAQSMPCGTVRGSLSLPESFDSVPTHANVSFRVPARPSGDARAGHRESSGPPGADETGEIRASRRVSHFGARPGDRVGGVFFHRARPCRSPLTLLSPPSLRRSNRFRRVGFASKAAKIDSRVCPVKSNRIPDRERLPSDSRFCAPRVRRGGNEAA